MTRQLKLFEGTEEYKLIRSLTKKGLDDVSQIVIFLLNEAISDPSSRRLPIAAYDIARFRQDLEKDAKIDAELAEEFVGIVHQIQDERYRIKARIEELSEYRIALVDAYDGESPLSGRRYRSTVAFALRDSEAGVRDSGYQLLLTLGKLEQTASRLDPSGLASSRIRALRSELTPLLPERVEETESAKLF